MPAPAFDPMRPFNFAKPKKVKGTKKAKKKTSTGKQSKALRQQYAIHGFGGS